MENLKISKANTQINKIKAKLDKDGRSKDFSLGDAEIEYVTSRGIEILRLHATDFIQKRIAPAEPKNDGHQTPAKGHPVFIALATSSFPVPDSPRINTVAVLSAT